MEKLGQTPPTGRQLFMLRMMGLLAAARERVADGARIRGFVLLLVLVFALLAVGFGLAKLIALPFGGVGTFARPATRARDRRRRAARAHAGGPPAPGEGAREGTRGCAGTGAPDAPALGVERGREPAPVLARQRVVRAELGEDRHHHLTDQVALLAARPRRTRSWRCSSAVARSPASQASNALLERRRRRPRAGRGHAGRPRRSRSGAARASSAPRPSRPARSACARAPSRRRRAAGRPRARVAARPRRRTRRRRRRPAAASDGTSLSKNASTWAGGIAPVNSAATFPSRNAFTAGIPRMPKAADEVLVGVGVDLREVDAPVAGGRRLLERRRELAARPAPLGPEVHDHRHLARALDDALREVGLGYVVDHADPE